MERLAAIHYASLLFSRQTDYGKHRIMLNKEWNLLPGVFLQVAISTVNTSTQNNEQEIQNKDFNCGMS